MAWKLDGIEKRFHKYGTVINYMKILQTVSQGLTKPTRVYKVAFLCCGKIVELTHKSVCEREKRGNNKCLKCTQRALRQKRGTARCMIKLTDNEPYNVLQPLWEKPPSATGGIWEDSR